MTTEYDRNVLAHIQAHEAKGETAAVKAHLASPKHKAIVDAAEAVVAPPAKPTDPELPEMPELPEIPIGVAVEVKGKGGNKQKS